MSEQAGVKNRLNAIELEKKSWEKQIAKQEEFIKSPFLLEGIKVLAGLVLVCKDRIGGYTKSGNIIVPISKESAKEDRMKFLMSPHFVAACDSNLEEQFGVKKGQIIMFSGSAEPCGEILIKGVAFWMYNCYDIQLVLEKEIAESYQIIEK